MANLRNGQRTLDVIYEIYLIEKRSFDQKYKFSNKKSDMVCEWRNFKNIFPRPLFTIIFRPKILFFCHIFNFDRADQSWSCHILGVNSFRLLLTFNCWHIPDIDGSGVCDILIYFLIFGVFFCAEVRVIT